MSEIAADITNLAKKYAGFIARGTLTPEEVIYAAIHAERQQAATIAYIICAETRHVSLGDAAREAIMKGLEP